MCKHAQSHYGHPQAHAGTSNAGNANLPCARAGTDNPTNRQFADEGDDTQFRHITVVEDLRVPDIEFLRSTAGLDKVRCDCSNATSGVT